jgi:hypothetical protein
MLQDIPRDSKGYQRHAHFAGGAGVPPICAPQDYTCKEMQGVIYVIYVICNPEYWIIDKPPCFFSVDFQLQRRRTVGIVVRLSHRGSSAPWGIEIPYVNYHYSV